VKAIAALNNVHPPSAGSGQAGGSLRVFTCAGGKVQASSFLGSSQIRLSGVVSSHQPVPRMGIPHSASASGALRGRTPLGRSQQLRCICRRDITYQNFTHGVVIFKKAVSSE
jgi:hypothetical protein